MTCNSSDKTFWLSFCCFILCLETTVLLLKSLQRLTCCKSKMHYTNLCKHLFARLRMQTLLYAKICFLITKPLTTINTNMNLSG